jgi:signal transduction histidine kinase
VNVPLEFPSLVSDLPSLTRIISELLNNACKYTPANKQIQITVQLANPSHRITQADTPSNAYQDLRTPSVHIIIRNFGVEIHSEHLFRIFDPFYRIPNNDPWKHGGTGLGLALVKRLVEYIQGTINVTSDRNGTTFVVQLPLNLSESAD